MNFLRPLYQQQYQAHDFLAGQVAARQPTYAIDIQMMYERAIAASGIMRHAPTEQWDGQVVPKRGAALIRHTKYCYALSYLMPLFSSHHGAAELGCAGVPQVHLPPAYPSHFSLPSFQIRKLEENMRRPPSPEISAAKPDPMPPASRKPRYTINSPVESDNSQNVINMISDS